MTVGWKTLDVGARALVYAHDGRARIEVGPTQLFLWREKFVPLIPYSADQNQFLQIVYHSGYIEHRPGPCYVFKNPLEHCTISVREGVPLDANEIVVVYNQETDGVNHDVTRSLQYGPAIYIPKSNEWLHEFSWHGTDPNNKTQLISGLQKFTKLQVIPDQFYYNVDEVRTKDDALMRIKLMMFYELRDIELMLNSTQDPLADFINCLCGDVVAFAAKLSYVEFMEHAEELNQLSKYPQLLERCKSIGYEVSKVVFRGYFASPKLQAMHDNAIQTRTSLKIAYETQAQEQDMVDLSIKNELARIKAEQSLELEQLVHKHQMECHQQKHQLDLMKEKCLEKIRHTGRDDMAQLEAKKANDEQELDFFKSLHGLGVDLTTYAQIKNPHPHKVVKVVTQSNAANLHLHQTNSTL